MRQEGKSTGAAGRGVRVIKQEQGAAGKILNTVSNGALKRVDSLAHT